MKRSIMPEIWGLLGLAFMVGSIFMHGPRGNFVCIMGMLGMIFGAILDVRRELDRWRRM